MLINVNISKTLAKVKHVRPWAEGGQMVTDEIWQPKRGSFLEDPKALQRYRMRADLTAAALGEAAGCSVDIVRNIECGRTKLRGPIVDKLWNVIFRELGAKQKRGESGLVTLTALMELSSEPGAVIARLQKEVREQKQIIQFLEESCALAREVVNAQREYIVWLEKEGGALGERWKKIASQKAAELAKVRQLYEVETDAALKHEQAAAAAERARRLREKLSQPDEEKASQ